MKRWKVTWLTGRLVEVVLVTAALFAWGVVVERPEVLGYVKSISLALFSTLFFGTVSGYFIITAIYMKESRATPWRIITVMASLFCVTFTIFSIFIDFNLTGAIKMGLLGLAVSIFANSVAMVLFRNRD